MIDKDTKYIEEFMDRYDAHDDVWFRSILKAVREEERSKHFEGIRRWAEIAWEKGWLRRSFWRTDADEVSASIQSYAEGNDLSSNSKEV